jgi:hypothetical protein
MSECCFCSNSVDDSQPGALTLVVTARLQEPDRATAQYWCHGHCRGERLAAHVPFDPEAFDD